MVKYANAFTKHFPKHEKYVLAEKIRLLTYEVLELVIVVNKKFHKKTDLSNLNVKHEVLRQMVNMSLELGYTTPKRYHHLSLLIDEIGKMIGAWFKTLDN